MRAHMDFTPWRQFFRNIWEGENAGAINYSKVRNLEADDARPPLAPDATHEYGRWIWTFCITILALNLLGLIVVFSLLAQRVNNGSSEERTVFPIKEYERRVFSPQDLFPTPETDALWEAELPKARGFILIEDPEQFGLPPGSPFEGGYKRYGVSWAHQYHCLKMLRDEFWAQLQNRSELVGMQVDINKTHFTEDERRLLHKAHCYDYLRQVILCHMDMTLEFPVGESKMKSTIDGYGVPHQCVKRDPLDEYMLQHAPEGYVIKPGRHDHTGQ